MSFDLWSGRRLLLAGWGEDWLWLFAGALALILLLGLYRYERCLVPRGAGLVLLGLRTVAALALVCALLEPISTRSYRESVRGRLIVGVDLSASMDTADPQRPAEERQRLAETLGIESAEEAGELARLQIHHRLLTSPAFKALARDFDIEAFGFAKDLLPGRLEDLIATLEDPDSIARLPRSVTQWSPVLEQALVEQADAPVVGVILLTDGLENAPQAGEGADLAERLASRNLPIYPVLVGSTVPPRDAAVASVQAPETVFLGDLASVLVEVKADGFSPGTEIPVTLERPGASPLEQIVAVRADGVRPFAAFRVLLEEPGPQNLTLAVHPPGGLDSRPDNDRKSISVQVADDKARVLLVDGEARWEFRYLRNALARDPRIDLEAVLLRPPPIPETADPTYPIDWPSWDSGLETGTDPLQEFDVLIVGDIPPENVPTDFWERLDAFIGERGGTLIVSPGPRSWQTLWTDSEVGRRLIPVQEPIPLPFDPEAIDPERPALPAGIALQPALGAGSESWPMLQFAADPEESQAIWADLAPLPWVLGGRAKPGATALALASRSAKISDPERSVIMAAQPYGLGKVLWIGTDGTWRWRLRVGDRDHHRFWGQAVRWATSERLPSGNRLVRFGLDQTRIAEGEPPSFLARFSEEAPGISPDLLAAARIYAVEDLGNDDGNSDSETRPVNPASEPVALVSLRPSLDRPRTFLATATPLPVGSYLARLDVPELAEALKAAGPEAPEARFEVVSPETSERIELAAFRDALDRLASATGGIVLADHEAQKLPDRLQALRQDRVRIEQSSIWDTPWTLGLFFSLLAIEWGLRKRLGLP